MKASSVNDLVRVAVAQSVKDRSPWKIPAKAKLQELGYGEAEIVELKTRLYKALSGKKGFNFSKFESTLKLTPKSTVKSVTEKLPKALGVTTKGGRGARARMSAISGRDPTPIKVRQDVDTAVRAVLSEKTRDYNFAQIKGGMKLGRDLKLGESEIAEVKLDLYKTLASKRSNFSDFFSGVDVGRDSTVKTMVDRVSGGLRREGWLDEAGDDPTKVKG